MIGDGENKKGRLEVWRGGEWGTVCDDGFEDDDARVVCKTLGLAGGEKFSSWSGYGVGAIDSNSVASERELGVAGSGRIWLESIDCKGTESSLFYCPRVANTTNWGKHDCQHQEDVFVTCT